MKKRIIVIRAYWTFNAMFPKAEPMKGLENSMIESVNIYDNENNDIILSDDELQKLMNYINGVVATRTMNVNDYPSARLYYVMEIKITEGIIRYMIYEENGVSYAEILYEGVYQRERETMEILKQQRGLFMKCPYCGKEMCLAKFGQNYVFVKSKVDEWMEKSVQ